MRSKIFNLFAATSWKVNRKWRQKYVMNRLGYKVARFPFWENIIKRQINAFFDI
jgi:hypothetical protein